MHLTFFANFARNAAITKQILNRVHHKFWCAIREAQRTPGKPKSFWFKNKMHLTFFANFATSRFKKVFGFLFYFW